MQLFYIIQTYEMYIYVSIDNIDSINILKRIDFYRHLLNKKAVQKKYAFYIK